MFVKLPVAVVWAPVLVICRTESPMFRLAAYRTNSVGATSREANAGAPAPPSTEEMGEVVLLSVPRVDADTRTVIAHEFGLVPSTPFESVIVVPPAGAVATPAQLPANPFGVATTSPGGRLSVKPKPVKV